MGNGVFDGDITSRARIPFLYGHGAMSTTAYAEAQAACNANFSKVNADDAACDKVQNDAEAMAANLNPYDFYRTSRVDRCSMYTTNPSQCPAACVPPRHNALHVRTVPRALRSVSASPFNRCFGTDVAPEHNSTFLSSGDCYLGPEQAARAALQPVNVFEIDRSPATALRKLIESAPRPAHPAVAAAFRRSQGPRQQLGETAPCIDSHGEDV